MFNFFSFKCLPFKFYVTWSRCNKITIPILFILYNVIKQKIQIRDIIWQRVIQKCFPGKKAASFDIMSMNDVKKTNNDVLLMKNGNDLTRKWN